MSAPSVQPDERPTTRQAGQPAIGRSVLRKEDRPLLTGLGCFVDDHQPPGTAHAAVLRSPHAHAKIASLDVSVAREQPGVLDVVTAADVPAEVRIPIRMHSQPGMERYLQPPLGRDRVRYSGEPVAVVVAESRYAAEDAVAEIAVEYQPLPPLLDAREAAADAATPLFADAGTNVAAEVEVSSGDVHAAFASAHLIVEERISCQRHASVPLEPRGLVAEHDPRTGIVTVWGAAKIVHINRRILARLLGWPEERVRLIELDVGGGFGGRGEFYPEDYLIPLCAIRLGRPVKWTADREEELRTTNHSREQFHEIALAVGAEGEFLALRDRVVFDTGAYVRTHGTVVPSMTAGLLPGPYEWHAYECRAIQVVTNKTPAGTYRAPGRYEANLARERIIDIAARRLGLEPDEIRRRNLVAPARMPHRSGGAIRGRPVVYDSGDYPGALAKGLATFDWDEMSAWRARGRRAGRRRGLGIAFFVEKSAIAEWDYARVELDSVGRAVVHAGSASIGQGVDTVLAQICADGLGIGYDDVAAVLHGDTDDVPDGMGSFGSRATAIAGAAVLQAAEALRVRILRYAAEVLEANEQDLEIADGRVVVRGSPELAVSLREVAEAARPARALRRGLEPGLSEESYFFSEDMSFPYGVHCAAVDVDIETGGVEIERYAIAYDVGRAINPMLIRGQIVGGAAQGIGGALLEEFAYTPDGQLAAGSFMDYLLPTAVETVAMRVLVTEDAPSPLNPIGAKGAGEGGTAAAGAAIANAVSDALGAEVTELPITPELAVSLASARI
jgi:carbon-monoxide dehydrogenase large subunit